MIEKITWLFEQLFKDDSKIDDKMISIELLEKICPKTKSSILESYVEPLNKYCKQYDITTTKNRLAAFLAQVAHESAGFNITTENLNYSSSGLRTIFGKYFPTEELANEYARQPEKIANKVYANRMGNSDESSGDGWKYRGRGLIQLTGKHNYELYSNRMKMKVDEAIVHLGTSYGAVSSAVWFWDFNNLNRYCDNDDFIGLTKRINGGTNGLSDRIQYYERALAALDANEKLGD